MVAAALAQLAAEDQQLADQADVALNSLTWDEGLDTITQLRMQEWLWHKLPVKFWTDLAEWAQLAGALGRLLDILDLPRYAEVCRSTRTLEILAAYNRDEQEGRSAFRRAMDASGVSPPDVPELTWGDVMGVEELQAHESASGALELAIEAGEVRLGTRGWRKQQQAVIRRQLLIRRPDLADSCWLDRVHEERVERWLSSRGDSRRTLLTGRRDAILGPQVPVPDRVGEHVAPVRWLLERALVGVQLTQTDRLRPAAVAEMGREFGWWAESSTRLLEADSGEVGAVRRLARRVGAVRRIGHRLVLTASGRGLVADDTALWRALCGRLLDDGGFSAAAGEIALALLLDGEAETHDDVSMAVGMRIAEEAWTDQDSGDGPGPSAVSSALGHLHAALYVLRLLDVAPGTTWWDSFGWKLNPAGRAAALVAMQTRALRPRRSVWETH